MQRHVRGPSSLRLWCVELACGLRACARRLSGTRSVRTVRSVGQMSADEANELRFECDRALGAKCFQMCLPLANGRRTIVQQSFLDRAVHPLDLAVGPSFPDHGQTIFDAFLANMSNISDVAGSRPIATSRRRCASINRGASCWYANGGIPGHRAISISRAWPTTRSAQLSDHRPGNANPFDTTMSGGGAASSAAHHYIPHWRWFQSLD